MKKFYFHLILSAILTLLVSAQSGLSQTSDELRSLTRELEELKQEQRAIQKDLQEIKNRLQSLGVLPEEPKNLFLNIADKRFKGDKNAKFILIEFSEYE